MELTFLFGLLAGILGVVAFIPYVISIFKKETRPSQVTWLIWTIVGTIMAVSYYVGGARDTMWVAGSYAFCYLIIFVLSIKYGEGVWNKTDKLCLVVAGSAILLWWFSGSALTALLASLIADFMGAFPTISKAYYEPWSEDLIAWTFTFASSLINLFAVGNWYLNLDSFSIWVYPLYMFLANGTIFLFIWLRPKYLKSKI